MKRQRNVVKKTDRYVPDRHRNERSANDEKIEQIKSWSAKRALMDDEAIWDHFEADFDREDSSEKVVKVIQYL